ncbi:MAG: DUF115 domain-containing protein [Treponema sp.]|jgi:hypothetical protein|nr:DUF115 domain-containing protein [Treponema sp.]
MNETSSGFARAERLHSRYRPQAEAERYIDALNLSGTIKYFILIEPGLGYLVRALRDRYGNSKIIVLHADSGFRAAAPDVPAWYPDSGETAQCFLEREIPDVAASSVKIIEWRPSLRFYGETCLALIAETAEFIKRADAGYRTAAAFGGRWVANFFRNLALIRVALYFKGMSIPILITGSGPSLETALPRIAAMKDRVFILAASSSVMALRERGLESDMVIATDGGAWALTHLYPCFRRPRAIIRGLAPALSAALPSQCAALPFLVLNDGSLWQSLVLNELRIPSVIVPQRGTVTASAVELALSLSSGNIYLTGMDLSVRDIRTHARPYGFDHLFFGAATRLRPVYSQCFTRSRSTSQGGSHDIYAAWFKTRIAARPGRIFSLGDNHAVFENPGGDPARDLYESAASAKDSFKEIPLSGEGPERCRRGAETLCRALDDPRYAKTIRGELIPLLFPGEKRSDRELKETLLDMAGPYAGESRG